MANLKSRLALLCAGAAMTILFLVVLGGGSYAARLITGKQIKNNSVTGKDIKNNSATGRDIKNRSVRRKDLARGVLGTLNTSAFEATRDSGPKNVPGSSPPAYATVATLSGVEPGAYVIFAKTDLGDASGGHSFCKLTAEGDSDVSAHGVRPDFVAEAHHLQLVHAFTSPGTVTLACSARYTWEANDTKIIAIRVGKATETTVSG
jgi:hypothetical protein